MGRRELVWCGVAWCDLTWRSGCTVRCDGVWLGEVRMEWGGVGWDENGSGWERMARAGMG